MGQGVEIQEGNAITITDYRLRGYEAATYSLKPKTGGGVDAQLTSVETNKAGVVAKALKPRVPLFQFPRQARYIRFLYLLRVSNADHNMAILGSNEVDQLNGLTKQVQSDPAAGCRNLRRAYCMLGAAGNRGNRRG